MKPTNETAAFGRQFFSMCGFIACISGYADDVFPIQVIVMIVMIDLHD